IAVWIPQLKKVKNVSQEETVERKKTQIWRSPLAWSITLFMGLQSLIFYTTITWLPEILQEIGYSSSSAGWLFFFMQFSIISITFIISVVASKLKNQKLLGVLILIFFA